MAAAIENVIFIQVLIYLFPVSYSAPLSPNSPKNILDGRQIQPHSARTIRETSMVGKTFDFSFCSQDFTLTVGQKRINRQGVRLTSLDAAILSQYLHGETIEERVEVWCKTAVMTAILALSIDKHVSSFAIDELDRYQGDIILNVEQADDLLGIREGQDPPSLRPRHSLNKREEFAKWKSNAKEVVKSRPKRKISSHPVHYWDNQVIPWRFHPRSRYDKSGRDAILAGIEHWESNTCFDMPMDNNPRGPHMNFIDGNNCYSAIGRLQRTRGQEVSVGKGCLLLGIVVHEIGHVIGLFHEQARPDRDHYIELLTDHIKSDVASNFKREEWDNAITAGVPYDYASVMHYGKADFSIRKGFDVIRPKEPYMEDTIGQREGLSFYDMQAVNFKFCAKNCGQRTLEWDRCNHGGYRNPRNCEKCKCPTGFSPPYCEEPSSEGNVDCGEQVLTASLIPKSLTSPEYETSGHPANSGCAWLIKAPPGHRVELIFTGKFEMQRPDEDVPCEEGYVEVKYQGVSRNGPRFCFDRPPMTLISDDSQMLVRSRVGRTVPGFKVQFKAVLMSCGGCSPSPGAQEAPCMTTQLVDCSTVSPTRINHCFRSLPLCCDGYRLDGSSCIRSNTTAQTTKTSNIIITNVNTEAPTTVTTETTTTLTTKALTTKAPATKAPTTKTLATKAPTTKAPTTKAPTTKVPTTKVPSSQAPATKAPTTNAPTTNALATKAPATKAPTTEVPTTKAPSTKVPTTKAPTTEVPATKAPTTKAPTTKAPTTKAPKTVAAEAPTTATTEAPTTVPSTKTDAETTNAPNLLERGWADWDPYGACTKKCGNCGIAIRKRKCIDPPCRGHSLSFKRCPETPCENIRTTRTCIDRKSPCAWSSIFRSYQVCARTKICIDEPKPCCLGSLEEDRCVIP